MAGEKQTSMFERHLQTAIQLILVFLLAWAGLKLVELGENSARLEERMTYQAQQIQVLSRDLRSWSAEMRHLSERVQSLESRDG